MKKTELMIGDIIQVEGVPMKVLSVFLRKGLAAPDARDTDDYWVYAESNRGFLNGFSIDHPRPISCSMSLFEELGFERYTDDDKWKWRYISDTRYIIVTRMTSPSILGDVWFKMIIGNRSSDSVIPRVTYPFVNVHDFQHILRLPQVGLEELADSIKPNML